MFEDNLKKYRTEKGYSQAELAEKLFVTRQCVSKWEKGTTQPDLQTLAAIAQLLDVSTDALLTDAAGDKTALEAVFETQKRCYSYNKIFLIVNILAALFCCLAFTSLWRVMPNRIPAHWSGGEVDRYGSRTEIFLNLISVVTFLAVDLTTGFFLRKTPSVKIIVFTHCVFIFFQTAYLIFIIALYAIRITSVIVYINCLSAALLTCVSIAMHPKISDRNYWLGVRTRETLSDKTIWEKTNALACYLFGGVSLTIWVLSMALMSVWVFVGFAAYAVPTAVTIAYAKNALYKK